MRPWVTAQITDQAPYYMSRKRIDRAAARGKGTLSLFTHIYPCGFDRGVCAVLIVRQSTVLAFQVPDERLKEQGTPPGTKPYFWAFVGESARFQICVRLFREKGHQAMDESGLEASRQLGKGMTKPTWRTCAIYFNPTVP